MHVIPEQKFTYESYYHYHIKGVTTANIEWLEENNKQLQKHGKFLRRVVEPRESAF